MKLTTKFIITKATSVIYPEFTEEGKLQSVVMDNDKLIHIDAKPTAIIDYNLRYHGSSLKGACEGSRMILGGKYSMLPVIISAKLNMYWFPTKSPQREDCVWFGLHQINDYCAANKKQTHIKLDNKAEFFLNTSYGSFDNRYERACRLKTWNDRRTELLMVCERPETAMYLIRKDEKGRNYAVEID